MLKISAVSLVIVQNRDSMEVLQANDHILRLLKFFNDKIFGSYKV